MNSIYYILQYILSREYTDNSIKVAWRPSLNFKTENHNTLTSKRHKYDGKYSML